MNRDRLIELLGEVKSGATSIEKATEDLAQLPFVSVDSANIDTHRELRTGMPEVVFGQGKTVDEIVQITQKIVEAHGNALITRLSQEAAAKLVEAYPNHRYLERSKIIWINPNPESEGFDIDSEDYVAVVSAGTSDIPVADEAALTVQACNKSVKKVYDCGIAGIHRLLDKQEIIKKARVKIVVAGMEGALPSVVAGMFGGPVIGVPTSVGYGVSAAGIPAALSMLASCAPGVAVVNIDNGFGAGVIASQVIKS